MRVRLLASFAGATVLDRGVEAEFADDEAIRLIQAGFAAPVSAPVERAVKTAPETRKRKK